MQKANKLLCACLLLFCINIYAQTPPATTLNQAIEVIKARKTAELNINTQAYSNTPNFEPNLSSNKDKKADDSIKLWSIHGVGNDLRAEIVYQQKVVEVSFNNQKMKVGKWFLIGINEKEVEFSELNKNGKLSRTRLLLKLPQPSEFASIWPSPGLGTMNFTDGQSRPPVPMTMLKP